MSFTVRFRQGMKAAIPIWIAFAPSSVAWGIAAQRHGLSLEEIILMSAWVYSGPAQFAVLGPLAENKSSLQVLVAGFLMNLRFLPMSTALAPFFRGVKRLPLLSGISCGQREQLHRALFAVSKRTRWDDARAVGSAAGWL